MTLDNIKDIKNKLFLDDIRKPKHIYWDTVDFSWRIARDYKEFVREIEENGMPEFISFDHDLADEHYSQQMYKDPEKYNSYYTTKFREMTGYDCAKWLIDYCMTKKIKLPAFNVHSFNPVGAANIWAVLNNYKQHED